MPFVCGGQSDQPKQCRSAAPRAWPLILQSNVQLSSGIAFGSDCQITCRGPNLDSNFNSSAWPTSVQQVVKVFCSKIPEKTMWSLDSFKMKFVSNPHPRGCVNATKQLSASRLLPTKYFIYSHWSSKWSKKIYFRRPTQRLTKQNCHSLDFSSWAILLYSLAARKGTHWLANQALNGWVTWVTSSHCMRFWQWQLLGLKKKQEHIFTTGQNSIKYHHTL